MEIPGDVGREIQQLDELHRTQRTLATKLEAVSEQVQRIVPGCDSVSVTLIVEEAMFTAATSSQLAIEADLVQYRTGEGPCLDSSAHRATIRIEALQADERYVHFAPGAVELGVESVLSLPLGEPDAVGSINLYSRRADAFGDDVPDLIADHVAYATHLVATSHLYEASVDVLRRLVEVVRQATQVEIAVGMFIIGFGLSPSAAWERLGEQAAREGTSIVELAERLIAEHEAGVDRPPEDRPGPG